ncbi:ABC transporter substrate-binding protein [Streptomyces sp. DSM 44917]|uniref:ABC transporter substrate-binding protein n=1 Tax=Streptomyces boetiae TaxID=3075541 RepID=A0ABU2L7G6_9ACTN|nr:ABC transporter substrate-binding protein [Streptomyces sp. DSM 44917]MDT0307504.1 ABC transporter substrate-binding protein [Streptomyces sp. DSM 44917]
MTRSLPSRPGLAGTALASVGLLALTACGSGVSEPEEDGEGSAGAERTVVENCGREIELSAAPEAIVGLSPSQTELLLRLGLRDRMAGQAQTATAPLPEDLRAEAEDIPVLSEDAPPTREVLLEAGPDFVAAPTAYEFTAEQGFASVEQLEQAGVAAYIATGGCADRRMTGTVDDLFTDLEALGQALGVEEAAAGLTEEARATLEDVDERVADQEPLTVAQVYVEGSTLSAIGAGIEYDIIRRAGGENVFGPQDAAFADFFAAQINPETLAERDPQALVFAVNSPEHEEATRDYLTRTFPELDAVRNDRLVSISASDVYPGTLGNVDAVAEVAEGLYPEAF